MKLLLGRSCDSNCGMEGCCFILHLVWKGLRVAPNLWVGPSALFQLWSGYSSYSSKSSQGCFWCINGEINHSMRARARVLCTHAGLQAVMVACHAAGVAGQQVVHSACHISHCAITLE